MLSVLRAPAMEASYALMEETPFKLYDSLFPRQQTYEYERGLQCKWCKEVREKAGHKDPPMTFQKMMITQEYWLNQLHKNENEELIEKN